MLRSSKWVPGRTGREYHEHNCGIYLGLRRVGRDDSDGSGLNASVARNATNNTGAAVGPHQSRNERSAPHSIWGAGRRRLGDGESVRSGPHKVAHSPASPDARVPFRSRGRSEPTRRHMDTERTSKSWLVCGGGAGRENIPSRPRLRYDASKLLGLLPHRRAMEIGAGVLMLALSRCTTMSPLCSTFEPRDFRRGEAGIAANGDLLIYDKPAVKCP